MKRSTAAFLTFGAAAALVLAGCSQPVLEVEGPPSGAQSGSQSGASQSGEAVDEGTLTLSADQVQRIVSEIQADLDASVEAKDTAVLENRVTNPALKLREGQFVRAAKTETAIPELVLPTELHSATVGNSWPRILLVASNASGDKPAEVYFITQQEAKAQYKLENWTRLVGGTSVRGVGVRDGSKVLEADAAGLTMTPASVLTTYINHLNSPDNEEYSVFEDNVFGPRYREELKAVNEAVKVAGNVAATAKEGDYPIMGVSLEQGQALVSAAFNYSMTYNRTVPGSTFEMAGTPAAYLDDKNVIGSVTVNYLVSIFFLVPDEDSDAKISVVGSERVITGVDRDDTEPTE
ncbi:hypothetical protein [Actinomyces minihominis]|uniref:hypothetical protein n=1 Tax=Actinomyces minihominis TaxID=2002838 RepID=UPI000C07AF67|nr:hypothetical protein [Actinomyces minihominis]